MKRKINKISLILILITFLFPAKIFAYGNESEEQETTREERKFIRDGNDLYEQKRYADAELQYRKAISEKKSSEIGQYNLALSLLQQGKNYKDNQPNNPINQADSIFRTVSQESKNMQLVSKAYYNMGNIAFNREQYDQSIANYKDALRRNPYDDKARENLRLAQKKLKEQQDKKNQDKNKDQNKDKDKEKEQNKDKQDKKDQNKDNKDQQKQNPKDDKKDKQDQQQPKGAQGAASNDKAEQILNAVQNKEKATQQKVNMMKAREQERRDTKNKW